MGSVGNQNPWTPYYNFKDCSLGICSIYCPQFCYFIFPPPPPSSSSSSTPFSPLIIAIIGILTSAFILVSYYTIVTRYCKGNNRNTGVEGEEFVHNQWPVASTGLDESIIKTITVCKYRKGEGLIEGTECAVCLSEFQENEPLRLLPKCSHAFHLPCIDTWLKSQSNCPLCRANVTAHRPSTDARASVGVGVNAYEIRRPDDLVLVVDGCELDCCEQVVDGLILKSPVREDGVSDVQSVAQFRRSVSLGALQVEKDRFVAIKRCNSTGRFMPTLTTV